MFKVTTSSFSCFNPAFQEATPEIAKVAPGQSDQGNRRIDKNGTVFEGDFTNDKLNGPGTVTYRSGTVMKAKFVDGKVKGIVRIHHTDGTIFKCQSKDDGYLNGRGRVIYSNGKSVDAIFKNFKIDHLGLLGSVKAGEFRKEIRHGRLIDELNGLGKKIRERKVDEGIFCHGKLHGLGKRTRKFTVYEGPFLKGKLHGQVKIKFPVGFQYHLMTGKFSNGLFKGYGKIISPSGTISEGALKLHYPSRGRQYSDAAEQEEYERGLESEPICDDCSFCLHGRGKKTYQDGTVFNGLFNKGNFIKGLITKDGELIGRVEKGEFPPRFPLQFD